MAQLHYEMLVRNLPFNGNIAVATQLDLCIAIRVDNAQIAAEKEESESKVKGEPSDSPMNDAPSIDEEENDDDDDDNEDEDDDEEEPQKLNWRESGLIRHWEPKLQRFVTYRF
jgi:DNA-directed RNA polymerase specialized sigma subunit